MHDPRCPLCQPDAAPVLYRDDALRVVAVEDPRLAGYCRVIWNAHVAEMTLLDDFERARLMAAVWAVEAAVHAVLAPAKINLASLGNQVPHLHWHVIARFHDDPFFPDAVWAPPRRDGASRPTDWARLAALLCRQLAPG